MTMASSAGNNFPKSALGGEISPEDAERFAASFRPSWELDDAPFAAGGGLAQEDLLSLSADANTVVDLPKVEEPFTAAPSANAAVAAPAPPPAQAGAGTLVMKPAPAPAVPKPAPSAPTPGYNGGAPLYIKPGRGPSPSVSTRDDLEFPVRRSNKAVFVVIGAVVAVAAVAIGIKIGMSDDDAKGSGAGAAQTQPTSAPPAREEPTRAIPAPTTADTATTAAATKPAPPVKDTATTQAAKPEPPHPPAPTAAPPPPRPVAAAPQPAPRPAAAPQPAPQPKTPTKPAGGGIVRDNPF
jgi:hypothetical protein